MPRIDFAQFQYYPNLQTHTPELIGYRELSDASKRRLCPVFELTQKGLSPNLDASYADLRDTVGPYPFILDLSKETAPPAYLPPIPRDEDIARHDRDAQAVSAYNAMLSDLLNPTDGFAAWRAVAAQFPNAIPALQFTDPAAQSRQILRQAVMLSRNDDSIAIRITAEHAQALAVIVPEILSVLNSPEQLLVIADCGLGRARSRLVEHASFAGDTLASIVSELDIVQRFLVRAVCVSSSYARPSRDGLAEYANLDWRLWEDARAAFPFMFGDYGAMLRFSRTSTFVPPTWTPAVTLPTPGRWLTYKHPDSNDPNGWILGSREIVNRAEFAAAPRCWGTELIQRASTGNIAGADAIRFWHAARVNIHLTTQIDAAYDNVISYGEPDEE
jgi:hypothetical protein